MVIWWESAPRDEREAVLAIPSVREHLSEEDIARAVEAARLPHAVHEALLETLYASGADILILPIQDLFGWRDRINQPATVSDENWTWVCVAVDSTRPSHEPCRRHSGAAWSRNRTITYLQIPYNLPRSSPSCL